MRERYGTTLFVTTHYMEEAEALCTRIAIMNKGKIAALDTPGGLIDKVGKEDASLEDAFAFFTGSEIEEDTNGSWKAVRNTRRTANRLR